MPDTGKFNLTVLWEHEIRDAARRLRELYAVMEKKKESYEEREEEGQMVLDTINACMAALHGVEDDAALVLSSVPDVRKAIKKRGKTHA